MGNFDPIADTAFQLKSEAELIRVDFKQGQPTSSQGIVSWNIPSPFMGCSNPDPLGTYSGIIFLLSTSPLLPQHIPQDGLVYVADPTANTAAHAGDQINGAYVVGAFYECNKRGTTIPFTSSFIINDLVPNTTYYLAGYAVDCQIRYHKDGIRSYSDNLGRLDEQDFPAYQKISISSDGSSCITATDGTGLIYNSTYEFDVIIDDSYPIGNNAKTVNISIQGIDAGTYGQLIDNINNQLKLFDNPPQSPVAPNTGALQWVNNTKKLYTFDGSQSIETPVIVESTDPTLVPVDSYWVDSNNLLYKRISGSPNTWNLTQYITFFTSPSQPPASTLWFDGTITRRWNDTTWCDLTTYVSETNPDICLTPKLGWFWFDESTSTLNAWNVDNSRWEITEALSWDVAPNNLTANTYWFDLTNQLLNVYAGSPLGWTEVIVNIQTTAPIAPANGLLWFNLQTESLKQWNSTTLVWDELDVIVWASDPTNVDSCKLWWRTTDDVLMIWDQLNNEWDQVTNFFIGLDPLLPSPPAIDTTWFIPSTNTLKVYDGSSWFDVPAFITGTQEPTQPISGMVWFNTSNNLWFEYDGITWNSFDPVESLTDPSSPPIGTYWFNTSNNVLSVYNGFTWVPVAYSTQSYIPKRYSQWYNSTNNTLYEWKDMWVEKLPLVTASIGTCGVTFTSLARGSNVVVIVPAPSITQNSGVCFGTGFADTSDAGILQPTTCTYSGTNGTIGYSARLIPTGVFLWDNVTQPALVQWPIEGADGKLGTPTYNTIGVGTDGSPDERRDLMTSIREQLGYPVIEVELTTKQMDIAVNKALREFRKNSSMAYKRGFFFLDIKPRQQSYKLTNQRIGYHRIVNVTSAHRMTSAFLSTAHGGGIYGQVVMQHLYNMGTYDLTSYHLVAQYIEQLEHLFATRLVFSWNEYDRMLNFHQSFVRDERVLLDCSVERTEQDLLVDRYTRPWIEQYALAESMQILSQIRGKYASLPGAGGNVTLNGSELYSAAETLKADLLAQLDDFVVQNPEEYGMGSSMLLG